MSRRRPVRVSGFTPVTAPTCSVAEQEIDNGTDARCFAEYLRIHALSATSGLTYSQMGRYGQGRRPGGGDGRRGRHKQPGLRGDRFRAASPCPTAPASSG